METLKSVEVCEIAQIEVNGVTGTDIFLAAKECIKLVKLLNIAVKLHWNGRKIDVYKSTTLGQIIEKSIQPII